MGEMTMSSNLSANVVRLVPGGTEFRQNLAIDEKIPESLRCGATMTVQSDLCCIRLEVCALATVILHVMRIVTKWEYLFRVAPMPGPSDQVLQSLSVTLYLKKPNYFGASIDFARYGDTIHGELSVMFLGWRVRFPKPIIDLGASPEVVTLRAPR